jgi:hypothetical protein
MNLQFAPEPRASFPMQSPATGSRVSDVKLRHLQGEEAIAAVLHMREDNIDLSVLQAAAGPHFHDLEKKETKSVLCSASSSMAS